MDLVQALVKDLLQHPHDNEWSIQGLGMLRTYLTPEIRLHIWSEVAEVEGASKMHTHPWNFDSLVVAGRIRDYCFEEADGSSHETGGAIPRKRQTIRCGEGGGLVGDPEDVFLRELPTKTYETGQSYRHAACDIHYSVPDEGTVTIITREFQPDTEHAFVYFRDEWGTAEPRPATRAEVDAVCGSALERQFTFL